MPQLPILAQIAKKAGIAIQDMRPTVIANKDGKQQWEKTDEFGHKSIATKADLKGDEIIGAGLKEHFPGIAVVSEEHSTEARAAALMADERFDVDPLDNTHGFVVEGFNDFSVNIGRINKKGVPVAGAVYFPARQELYYTGDDGKAYLQRGDEKPGKIKAIRGLPPRKPLQVAIGHKQQDVSHLTERRYKAGEDFVTKPYAGQLRTCMVASGECDVSCINKGPDGGFNSWDIAGPHAVLLAAGGDIVGTDRKPVRYGKGTYKMPDHIAGANDVLLSLKLADKADLRRGWKLG